MPTYKLHYFNVKGFAEISRLLFAAAGVKYEDIRYERDTTWPAAKLKMPHGTVPVLEVDGEVLTESFAIAKYLAKTFGFAGNDCMEEARVDEVVEHTRDLMKDLLAFFYEKDEAKKALLQEEMKTVKLPAHLKKLEKDLCRNKNGDGFIVGDKLSMADLLVFMVLTDWIPEEQHDMWYAMCPKVKALLGRIGNIPAIKEWVEKRPKTDN